MLYILITLYCRAEIAEYPALMQLGFISIYIFNGVFEEEGGGGGKLL